MNTLPLLLALLYFAPTLIRVMWDDNTIDEKHKSINYPFHNTVTLVVTLIVVLILWLVAGVFPPKSLALCIGIYGLFFDAFLNVARNKHPWKYYGDFSDEENLSLIEKYVYAKMSWQAILICKLLWFSLAVFYFLF